MYNEQNKLLHNVDKKIFKLQKQLSAEQKNQTISNCNNLSLYKEFLVPCSSVQILHVSFILITNCKNISETKIAQEQVREIKMTIIKQEIIKK